MDPSSILVPPRWKIGEKVEVNGLGLGTVRFVGHVTKKGERVGVELNCQDGSNNGTVDGHSYFSCKQGYGILVPPSKVRKVVRSSPRRPPSTGDRGQIAEEVAEMQFWEELVKNVAPDDNLEWVKDTHSARVWNKGVPLHMRKMLWLRMSGAEALLDNSKTFYQETLAAMGEEIRGHDVPVFGCDWHAITTALVLRPENRNLFEQVLQCVAFVNPGLAYAPWVVGAVACCSNYFSEPQTFAIVQALLHHKGWDMVQSKAESWSHLALFENIAWQTCAPTASNIYTTYKYGEMTYFPNGTSKIDVKKTPPLGKMRHPFAGVCFLWSSLLNLDTMTWLLDNVFTQGPIAFHHFGLALIQLWEKFAQPQSSSSSFADLVTLEDVANSINSVSDLVERSGYIFKTIKPQSITKWMLKAAPVCQQAMTLSGRTLAATEFDEDLNATIRHVNAAGGSPSDQVVHRSSILSAKHSEAVKEIWAHIPARFHFMHCALTFSTETHGVSLRTLYEMTQDKSPLLLIFQTSAGAIFGCYLTNALSERHESVGSYFGAGETFVFTIQPVAQVFTWHIKQKEDTSQNNTPTATMYCPAISQLAHLSMILGMAIVTAEEEDVATDQGVTKHQDVIKKRQSLRDMLRFEIGADGTPMRSASLPISRRRSMGLVQLPSDFRTLSPSPIRKSNTNTFAVPRQSNTLGNNTTTTTQQTREERAKSSGSFRASTSSISPPTQSSSKPKRRNSRMMAVSKETEMLLTPQQQYQQQQQQQGKRSSLKKRLSLHSLSSSTNGSKTSLFTRRRSSLSPNGFVLTSPSVLISQTPPFSETSSTYQSRKSSVTSRRTSLNSMTSTSSRFVKTPPPITEEPHTPNDLSAPNTNTNTNNMITNNNINIHTNTNINTNNNTTNTNTIQKQDSNSVPTRTCYFIRATDKALCIGGGGAGHAIEIDDELQFGSSKRSTTFDNEPLIGEKHGDGSFECVALEAWSFDNQESAPAAMRRSTFFRAPSRSGSLTNSLDNSRTTSRTHSPVPTTALLQAFHAASQQPQPHPHQQQTQPQLQPQLHPQPQQPLLQPQPQQPQLQQRKSRQQIPQPQTNPFIDLTSKTPQFITTPPLTLLRPKPRLKQSASHV